MTQIVLKANAQRTVHDVTSFVDHLQNRAENIVDEELLTVLTAAQDIAGSSAVNKAAAYSFVTASVLRDLERVTVSGDHKIQLLQLRDSNQLLRNESSRFQVQLTQELAHRDQRIQELETEKSVLEYKNQSLIKTVELLTSELERCNRTLHESQENYVSLCFQSLQLKGDVDACCDTIIASIDSRIGFVPSTVVKAVVALKELKPPGEPSQEVLRKYEKKRVRQPKDKVSNKNFQQQYINDDLGSMSVGSNSVFLDLRMTPIDVVPPKIDEAPVFQRSAEEEADIQNIGDISGVSHSFPDSATLAATIGDPNNSNIR
jgi:hypothetical protein